MLTDKLRDCKHGNLARQCEICERDARIYELERECVNNHASVSRVVDWLNDPKRKPAIHAFTEGPDRTMAYWFEKEIAKRALEGK